jgi:hypothetical protein
VAGSISEAGHTCTASRVLRAGVYSVRVAVRDDDGGVGAARVRLVVVDPKAGSVAGGGTFASPRGALAASAWTPGRARFEFASGYRRGAARPTGEVELRLGRFHFRGEAQEWLVVAGARAQVQGSGEVNGKPGFGYLLTAYDDDPHQPCRRDDGGGEDGKGAWSRARRDGDGEGHRPPLVDRFRLKIWNRTTGAVVYDNVRGAPDDIDSASPAAVPQACVVITR